jgi:hypothetical protein
VSNSNVVDFSFPAAGERESFYPPNESAYSNCRPSLRQGYRKLVHRGTMLWIGLERELKLFALGDLHSSEDRARPEDNWL